jgi:hypothetical protein
MKNYMTKKFLTPILLILICGSLILSFSAPAVAQAPFEPGDECSGSISAGVQCFGARTFDQDTPPSIASIVAQFINIALLLLGIIFLILIIYSGYTWMTAMGQEDKIKKAKGTLTNAAIGLIIVLVSYALVSFIFVYLKYSNVFI